MATIDHSIYFQQQAPDLVGNFAEGMRLRDMADQRKLQGQKLQREQDKRNAYKQGVVQNPDGTVTVDPKKTLSALALVDPVEAQNYERQMMADKAQKQEMDWKQYKMGVDYMADNAWRVKNQDDWDRFLEGAQEKGIDVSDEPRIFDPNYAKRIALSGMSAKEQMDLKFKQNEDRRAQEKLDIEKSKDNRPKPPTGYRYAADGQSLEPIPGGPEAGKSEKAKQARDRQAGLVVQDLGRALNYLQSSDMAAGELAGQTSFIPGTPAYNLDNLLESAKSNIGFDKLQAMREASPTGGALGNVSEKEIDLLQATAGKLDTAMPDEILEDNIKRLLNQYNDIVHGPGEGPPRHQLSFDEQGNPIKQSGQKPRTVIQNGFTYTLNPSTGEYE